MSLAFEERKRDDPQILPLYADFIREADTELGLDVVEAELAAGPPRDLTPPNGVMLLAIRDGQAAGIGGVRHLDAEVAEVKSMYVAPGTAAVASGSRCSAGSRRSPARGAASRPGSTPPTI